MSSNCFTLISLNYSNIGITPVKIREFLRNSLFIRLLSPDPTRVEQVEPVDNANSTCHHSVAKHLGNLATRPDMP